MYKKIWLIFFLVLLLGLVIALFKSPFLASEGPFAQLQQFRALTAGIIGIIGTIILLIAGWFLLKKDLSE